MSCFASLCLMFFHLGALRGSRGLRTSPAWGRPTLIEVER